MKGPQPPEFFLGTPSLDRIVPGGEGDAEVSGIVRLEGSDSACATGYLEARVHKRRGIRLADTRGPAVRARWDDSFDPRRQWAVAPDPSVPNDDATSKVITLEQDRTEFQPHLSKLPHCAALHKRPDVSWRRERLWIQCGGLIERTATVDQRRTGNALNVQFIGFPFNAASMSSRNPFSTSPWN